MLEFTFDILELATGFWRFIFSRPFRSRTILRWTGERQSISGRLSIAVEVVLSTVIGVGLPLLLVLFLVANCSENI